MYSFNFEGIGEVRAFNREGDAWFVAKDVATLLGYTNTRKAILDHCKAAVSVGSNSALPLDPQTKIIPERDVYRLIMRSKLPSAVQFEEWVVGTVLPAIRKDGGYMVGEEHAKTDDEIIYLAMQMMQRKIADMQPKAEYHDEWMSAEGTYTTTEVAKKLGISATKLNKFLRDQQVKWQHKDLPRSGYEDWFKLVDYKYPTRAGFEVSSSCKVTPKGVQKIIQLFGKKAA